MKKRLVALFLVLTLSLSLLTVASAEKTASAGKTDTSQWFSDIPRRGGGSAPGTAKNTVYMFN